MTRSDPLSLAIRALNDIPRTTFRHPIGPYRDSYELVAYLAEVKRFSDEIIEAKTSGQEQEGSWKGFLYFDPASPA